MRLWTLHPKYLDAPGLNASWREGLLARNVLLGKTKGYTNHPQLIRFRNSPNPTMYIDAFLTEIYKEALSRGYSYSVDKIHIIEKVSPILVKKGQIVYECEHLKKKLKARSPHLLNTLPKSSEIIVHPLFKVIEGGIEDWEMIQ